MSDATRPARSPDPDLPVYGLDIETDTRIDGLDPSVGRIVAVAVASADGERVFDESDEALLLDRLDWHLAALEPGVLATWNGAGFDLPYLADRAHLLGVGLGLALQLDRTIPGRSAPLHGHAGRYRARWHHHAHVDAYRLYRSDVAPALGVSCSLKSIARLAGLAPIEVDCAHLHDLDAAACRAYVGSDARCTRELVLRRWPTARLAVDRPLETRVLHTPVLDVLTLEARVPAVPVR
jgi:hypothetical protein